MTLADKKLIKDKKHTVYKFSHAPPDINISIAPEIRPPSVNIKTEGKLGHFTILLMLGFVKYGGNLATQESWQARIG